MRIVGTIWSLSSSLHLKRPKPKNIKDRGHTIKIPVSELAGRKIYAIQDPFQPA